MNNLDDPIFPMGMEVRGLTVREFAAIVMLFPESGNPDLDKMITNAIQMKAGKAAFSAPDRPPTAG